MKLRNKKDRELIVATMNDGMKSDFWDVLNQSIEESLEALNKAKNNLDERIRALPAGEYKLENEIIFEKIKYLKHLQELPKSITLELQSLGTKRTEAPLDPYASPGDFEN